MMSESSEPKEARGKLKAALLELAAVTGLPFEELEHRAVEALKDPEFLARLMGATEELDEAEEGYREEMKRSEE